MKFLIRVVEKLTLLALCAAAGLLAGCKHAGAQPPQIAVSELRIPTPGSAPAGLAAVMMRPADNAPHPLALITHGTPRNGSERADMTPLSLIPQAREFARRGWTAVIVQRQGFGDSGGTYTEEEHTCGASPDYFTPIEAGAKQLREAAAYLATRPEIDASRSIGVGVSAGGAIMVALSANPPPGMAALIGFAPGRGSDAPDHVCNADALVAAFGYWGRQSKLPMLWVYATNDHFFGPQLAQSLNSAYTGNGGDATLVMSPAFGEDGHQLFSLAGIPQWTPAVDEFLMNRNLVLRQEPLPLPLPDVSPPYYLSAKGRQDFKLYLAAAPHKAFVASRQGFGWSSGKQSPEQAQQQAMAACARYAAGSACTAVMLDDEKTPN